MAGWRAPISHGTGRLPRSDPNAPFVCRPDTKASASSNASWSQSRGGGRASLRRQLSTRRLQPAADASARGQRRSPLPPSRSWLLGLGSGTYEDGNPDFAFAGLWCVGMVCAVAAAHQAKFHRLAALMLLGGAGLVTCVTFVWLSAPDLAVTQLVVEIVTTVLILLGLRWLPKRSRGPDRAERPPSSAAPVPRPVARGRGRPGHDGNILRSYDAHTAGIDCGLLHREKPTAKAAGATSST